MQNLPASACGEELPPDWSRPGRSSTPAPPPPRRASVTCPHHTRGIRPATDGLTRTAPELRPTHDRASAELSTLVERRSADRSGNFSYTGKNFLLSMGSADLFRLLPLI